MRRAERWGEAAARVASPILLVLLACGLGLLALVGSSLLAIPVVVLVCVIAYIWLSRKGADEKEAASPDDQERTPP